MPPPGPGLLGAVGLLPTLLSLSARWTLAVETALTGWVKTVAWDGGTAQPEERGSLTVHVQQCCAAQLGCSPSTSYTGGK